ncbi:MAG TPA: serine dehydrogenasease [Candidatus Dormibacteraeota bacterium]|nr:serine dehydrogenasease [Candidatus Dormibacteraeota bacterium]
MASQPSQAERDSNRIIEGQLDARLAALEAAAGADVIAYLGDMYSPADDWIKDAVEAITPHRRAVAFLIETPGGFITVAERIARILRHHYRRVDFFVPTYAMSAGTVLVMSGDSIYMDYASTLGPIDPQIRKEGQQVPALGYLRQFERLVDKSANGKLTTAELAYLLQNFDPAALYQYEQEEELSIKLLEEWLVKYKFKNWKKTQTQKLKVTKKMKVARANEIAKKLNNTALWHSHSRGIPMEVLRRDVKLLIDDFGLNEALSQAVHDYFRLLQDYQMRRSHFLMVIHTKGRYLGYGSN